MNTATTDLAQPWIDELREHVLAVGDAPFHVSPDIRRGAIDRLVAGIRDLNRSYTYDVATFDGVPAVQVESVDGRMIEIDFSGPSKTYSIKESSREVRDPRSVEMGSLNGIGCHGRRPFRFRSPTLFFGEQSPEAAERDGYARAGAFHVEHGDSDGRGA